MDAQQARNRPIRGTPIQLSAYSAACAMGRRVVQSLAAQPNNSNKLTAGKVLVPIVFWMPLDAKSETRRVSHPHSLDRAVRRPGLGDQPRRQPGDALVVKGVHAERLAAGQPGEGAAGSQAHAMGLGGARSRANGWSAGVEWSKRSGRSWRRWCRLPPSATFNSWKPRQIASSGTPAAIAARMSGRVVELRAGSSRRALRMGRAGIVVGAHVGTAAGEDQPIRRGRMPGTSASPAAGSITGMPSTGPSTART